MSLGLQPHLGVVHQAISSVVITGIHKHSRFFTFSAASSDSANIMLALLEQPPTPISTFPPRVSSAQGCGPVNTQPTASSWSWWTLPEPMLFSPEGPAQSPCFRQTLGTTFGGYFKQRDHQKTNQPKTTKGPK